MNTQGKAKRGSAEDRRKVTRTEARGLLALAERASTEEEWREVARRAGAIQRRSRQLGGLGRGG